MSRYDHNYHSISERLGTKTLGNRRKLFSLSYVYKIIIGQANCLNFLGQIGFCAAPKRIGKRYLFDTLLFKTNHGQRRFMGRIIKLGNSYDDIFDFRADSPICFKRKLQFHIRDI